MNARPANPLRFAIQCLMACAVLAVANAAIKHLTSNSYYHQILRRIDSACAPTTLFVGNSIVAAGIDESAFTLPGVSPLNIGLGATYPVEHLLLTRYALAQFRSINLVVYGNFDMELTENSTGTWTDLIGTRTIGYYVEPPLAAQLYAPNAPLDAMRIRYFHYFPLLVERAAFWSKVEKFRRKLEAVGMPAQANNRFGRAGDFAVLEAQSPEIFEARCTSAITSRAPLNAAADQLISTASQQGVPVLVVEMPVTSSHRIRFHSRAAWMQYRDYLRGLLTARGCRYFVTDDWSPDADFDDAVHLSPAGATAFSARLATELFRHGQSPLKPPAAP